MTRPIVALAVLALSACAPERADNTNTFTLATGITIASSVDVQGSPGDARTRLSANADLITVDVQDYFTGKGKVAQAWLSLPRHGIATLNIGTEQAKGSWSSKEEQLKRVVVTIKRDRLPRGTFLSVYNLDTSETLAHQSPP